MDSPRPAQILRNSIQQFVESLRLPQRLAITGRYVAAAVALASPSLLSTAHAQLRTGREERPLYHERLAAEQKAPKPRSTPESQVVPASYNGSRGSNSILEDAPVSVGSGVGPAPRFAEPGLVSGHAYEVHSNSDCGCNACGGGMVSDGGYDHFGNLAPTCASGCGIGSCYDLGCGPIATFIRNMSVRAEVPLYWRRAAGPPPLVTTAPSGTAALGQANTRILFGNGPLDDDATAGFRLTLGSSLTADGRYGLLFRYWNAGTQNDSYNFDSSQFPILARPFLNTTTVAAGVQDTQLIAENSATAQSNGNISINTHSEVDGLNIFLRRLMYRDRFTKVEWLYGYQHIKIGEQLSINSSTEVVRNPNPLLVGTSIDVSDNFATENYFNGVVYGLMSSRDVGCFRFESTFRLGLGNLQRRVNIDGSTTTTSAAPASLTNTTSQGLLARNTNNQPFKDDTFVVVPEVGVNAAYRIRRNLDFNVGYNYMLVPKVAQASRQLDKQLAVNLSNPLTGNLDPERSFEERKYWLNSLGLGLQWNY
jgi:hypothetical protein